MRWYTKLAVVMTAAVSVAGAVLTTHALTDIPFEPVEVCAGEESYAVAERIHDRWQVSLLGQDGKRRRRYSIPKEIGNSRKTELSYDSEEYYFWSLDLSDSSDTAMQDLTVYRLGQKKNEKPTVLTTAQNEVLYGMHVHQGMLSVVGVRPAGKQDIQFTVYTAGAGARFEPTYEVTLPSLFIRDAVYSSDGTLCFLSGAGRCYVYDFKLEDTKPVVISMETTGHHLCIDEKDQVYIIRENGKAERIGEGYALEPVMEDMADKLAAQGISIADCLDVDILSDSYAAAIYQTEAAQWQGMLYRNEMTVGIDKIDRFAWWLKALIFLGFLIVYLAAALLLWAAVLTCLSDDATLRYRTAFVCLTSAVLALTGVTVELSQLYQKQNREQAWERMAILLSNAEQYIDPQHHREVMKLGQIDLDITPIYSAQAGFMTQLRTFVSRSSLHGEQFLLFVEGKDGQLHAVSGSDEVLGRSVAQLYDRKNAEQLRSLYAGEILQGRGTITQYGTQWIFMAERFESDDHSNSGILVLQTPASNVNKSLERLILAAFVLYLMVILFITLLQWRLRRAIRPLSEMEDQAQRFMLHGSFDASIVKGNNEIALLSRRFQHAIGELIASMEQSRLSAESYSRFLNRGWMELLGKENLFQIHAGDKAVCQTAVLEMRLTPLPGSGAVSRQVYEKLLTAIRNNQGIPERLEPERMRFLFPKGSFYAICAASIIREMTEQEYDMVAVIDLGPTEIRVLGDDQHSRLCSYLDGELSSFPIMRRVSGEYDCAILATDAAVQAIESFRDVFNSRIIGFFRLSGEDTDPIRLVEILPQKKGNAFEEAVGQYLSGEYVRAFTGFCQVLERDPDDHAAAHYLQLCHRAMSGGGK